MVKNCFSFSFIHTPDLYRFNSAKPDYENDNVLNTVDASGKINNYFILMHMGKQENCPEQFNFEEEISGNGSLNNLILHNDDVHSFEYVIDVLVKVCNHDVHQAEQCAYITHYKGKCDVKKGGIEELAPLRYMLIEKGLQATID